MKMSELHAAFGLSGLDGVGEEIAARARIAEVYKSRLAPLDGIGIVTRGRGFEPNWSHFAIRVDEKAAGMSRDALFTRLGELNIHCRKHFNPLTTRIPLYAGLPSAAPENPPNAHRFERDALRPPIYEDTSVDLAAAAALHSIVGSADNGI